LYCSTIREPYFFSGPDPLDEGAAELLARGPFLRQHLLDHGLVAIPAWSVPRTQSAFRPRIRFIRTSASCIEPFSA
jgi:hypothetical protein